MPTCSFCGREFIADILLMDANNNTYCQDCARKHFDKHKIRFDEFIRKLP